MWFKLYVRDLVCCEHWRQLCVTLGCFDEVGGNVRVTIDALAMWNSVGACAP